LILSLGFACLVPISSVVADESAGGAKTLWQIGAKDASASELALGPNGYSQFSDDPVFIVGVSDAKKDWPYVQPGPNDAWANARRHDFSICFALKQKPAAKYTLTVSLIDAQYQSPPLIGIQVNGKQIATKQPPKGTSDAALNGDPAQGKASEFSIDIPADDLKAGANEITLTTLNGSWMVYDCVTFTGPQNAEIAPLADFALIRNIESIPALVNQEGKLFQYVEANVLDYGVRYGSQGTAELKIPGRSPVMLPVTGGRQNLTFAVPELDKEAVATLEIKTGDRVLASREVAVKPVRKWVLYFLPHSHVDIGYTQLQTDVLVKQCKNLEIAADLAKKTAGNPPGERFKWNAEVLWPIDNYLRKESPEKQQAIIEAIRRGDIELEAFYGNELTALCRPEELVRLVEAAGAIGRRCGVKVESAMISDVPGYTWGLVDVLSTAGVKYFSVGPNPGDRIGRLLADLGDKPFYWVSPSGKEKILCWIAGKGYANFHGATLAQMGERPMFDYIQSLDREKYPYDYVQMRYTVNGDNGPPDTTLVETVQKWNAKYAYPKLVISTTTEMMKDFEKRYGGAIPKLQGDITPYWEDGAASSARETVLNRAAADRLAQAETLWTLLDRAKYPSEKFSDAWREVLLYDEHTWGAYNSISEPDLPFVKDQWKIKQAFALDADAKSRKLFDQITTPQGKSPEKTGVFQVVNTCAWPRTDLVILPKGKTEKLGLVLDEKGQTVPTQRLLSGDLAFIAKDIPAFGGRTYRLKEGIAAANDKVAAANQLASDRVHVLFDEKSGDIKSLKIAGSDREYVAPNGGGLNQYRYVLGSDSAGAKASGQAKISIKESGPIVTSAIVESDSPGCKKLTREVRLIAGIDRVDIVNLVDKKAIRDKEGVHFGYPFNVPEGVVRMDLAWSVIRPNLDQLPGSCKNWFTVQRWVDVSNADCGVTWTTIDAPLVEIGAMSGNLIGSQTNPAAWIKDLAPSQTLYSWAMNNHWHTNYCADQEGPTVFRYALRPHVGGYDPVAAMRFGIEQSQPLQVVESTTAVSQLLALDGWPANVIIAGMKPSDDGKAIVLRLQEVAGKDTEVKLQWRGNPPKAVWQSNPFEEPVSRENGAINIAGKGVLTLRIDF
jgi:hypothetical protein